MDGDPLQLREHAGWVTGGCSSCSAAWSLSRAEQRPQEKASPFLPPHHDGKDKRRQGNFRLLYKVTVIRTAWYGRKTDSQTNRMELRVQENTHRCTGNQLSTNRAGKAQGHVLSVTRPLTPRTKITTQRADAFEPERAAAYVMLSSPCESCQTVKEVKPFLLKVCEITEEKRKLPKTLGEATVALSPTAGEDSVLRSCRPVSLMATHGKP